MESKKVTSDPVDVCPNMTDTLMMCTGVRGGTTGECNACKKRALEKIKEEMSKSRDQRRKEEKKAMKKSKKSGNVQKHNVYEIEEPIILETGEMEGEKETKTAGNLTENKGCCCRFLHRLCCFGTGQKRAEKEDKKKLLDETSEGDSAETGTAAGVGTFPKVARSPPVKNKDRPDDRMITESAQTNLPDIHEQIPESAGFKKQNVPKGKQKRAPKKDDKRDRKILNQASKGGASTTDDKINPQVTKCPPIKSQNKDPENMTEIDQNNLTDTHEQIPESAGVKKQNVPKRKQKGAPKTDDKRDKQILAQTSKGGTSKTDDKINPQDAKSPTIKVAKKGTNVAKGNRVGDPSKPSTSKAARKPHEEREIIKYEQEGKTIKADYCKTGEGPFMFPPAPNSPYIDIFPEGSILTKGNEQDKDRQEGDEAEVSVFRAFESLGSGHGQNMTVLQGLEYTHGQYTLFVGDHKKKDKLCSMKNKEKEGECDFVVIGPNYIVIIEVKNVDKKNVDKQEAFLNNLTASYTQRERTAQLIVKIKEQVGCDKSTKVLQVSAFPNFSKYVKTNFAFFSKCCPLFFRRRHVGLTLGLGVEEIKHIIFKEDLDDLTVWWENNILIY